MYNLCVVLGFGVIFCVVVNGCVIYCGKILIVEVNKWIEDVWLFYYIKFQLLFDENCCDFGEVVLIDCYFMFYEVLGGQLLVGQFFEIVLGDWFGVLVVLWFVECVEVVFV